MKDLYYADRADKNGNRLITSYTNEKGCVKYGGTVSSVGLKYADFSDGGLRLVANEDAGPLVRSLMVNARPTGESSGRYVLMGKMRGEWAETPFRFTQYGAANTAMKAMIGMYEALAVVDSEEVDDDRGDEAGTSAGDLSGSF